jgi:hypothetical protein
MAIDPRRQGWLIDYRQFATVAAALNFCRQMNNK